MIKSDTYRTFDEKLNKKLFQQRHAPQQTVVLKGTSFGMEMLCIQFKAIILFRTIISYKYKGFIFSNSFIFKNRISSLKKYNLFTRLAGVFRDTVSPLQLFVSIVITRRHSKIIAGVINATEKEAKKLPGFHCRDNPDVRWSVTKLLVTDRYYSRRNYSAISPGDDSMIFRDCLRF